MDKKLKQLALLLQSKINLTTDNKSQFKQNVINTFKVNEIKRMIDLLDKHTDFIGKEVYKYKKSFSVTTLDEYNNNDDISYKTFNPIEETPFLYTLADYKKFEKDYINFRIERYQTELIERMPYESSTDTLSNLVYLWHIEAKQEILTFLKG